MASGSPATSSRWRSATSACTPAHVDSRNVIVTDRRHTQAAPHFPETYARLAATVPPLAENSVVVMGGFIGSTEDGVTTTLGRGGSDFTASIVGAGIGAEEIQIWTDVDGMLTADPTILPGGHRVKTISFAEAAELAYFGAKVLHPATVVPAIEKNIPVLILNSRRPEVPGTRITAETVPLRQRGQVDRLQAQDHAGEHPLHPHADGARLPAAHLRSLRPLRDAGRHGGDLRGQRLADHRQHQQHRRDSAASCGSSPKSTMENDQAIVCLVGENIRYTPGVARRVFNSLDGINIRMISQGASLLNLSFVVAEADLVRAVEALHDGILRRSSIPNVFERNEAVHA